MTTAINSYLNRKAITFFITLHKIKLGLNRVVTEVGKMVKTTAILKIKKCSYIHYECISLAT